MDTWVFVSVSGYCPTDWMDGIKHWIGACVLLTYLMIPAGYFSLFCDVRKRRKHISFRGILMMIIHNTTCSELTFYLCDYSTASDCGCAYASSCADCFVIGSCYSFPAFWLEAGTVDV